MEKLIVENEKFNTIGEMFSLKNDFAIIAGPCSIESEEQTEGTDEAEPWKECQTGHERSETVHDRLAELLRDSVHEAEDAGMGQMAAAQDSGIYLEAMEEAENQTEKPDEAGRAGVFCANGGEQQKRLLVYGRNRSRDKRHNKRKTRTRRVL